MSTTNELEHYQGQIYTMAVHLQERKNYKEKKQTEAYKKCDSLMIDHQNKTFWFTSKSTAEHTKQLVK